MSSTNEAPKLYGPELDELQIRTRAIARDVLLEAFGASATPFVPIPFVDDWVVARLLRRVARKVLARHASVEPAAQKALAKAVVSAYVDAGAAPLTTSVLVGAARFVARKVAIVLDVKKSHDVFGECIAFALGLDIAVTHGWVTGPAAPHIGISLYRTLQRVGSGPVEALARAGHGAFTSTGNAGTPRLEQLSEAIAGEVERVRTQLDPILRREVQGAPRP